jgi:hypothetical protein
LFISASRIIHKKGAKLLKCTNYNEVSTIPVGVLVIFATYTKGNNDFWNVEIIIEKVQLYTHKQNLHSDHGGDPPQLRSIRGGAPTPTSRP